MSKFDVRDRKPDADEVVRRLEEFRQRRGYLLPHQGAMAAALPDLQDEYGVIYKILTLDLHHLTAFEREFVWLSLLICAEEHVGTHHVKLFFEAGGTQAQADIAMRVAAWSKGGSAFSFIDQHWQPYFPECEAAQSYLRAFDALVDHHRHVDQALALLALSACHAAFGNKWPLEVALTACYASAVDEVKIAETLSLVLWPCGMNKFLDASGVWLELMRSGRVRPSAPFQAWADAAGQDGMVVDPGALVRKP